MSGKNPNDLSREWRLSFSRPPFAPIAAFLILLASMRSESLAQNTQPASSSALHEVVVTGRGTTDEEATKAAFVTALERTVGTIVHSSTVSRNFEIQSEIKQIKTAWTPNITQTSASVQEWQGTRQCMANTTTHLHSDCGCAHA